MPEVDVYVLQDLKVAVLYGRQTGQLRELEVVVLMAVVSLASLVAALLALLVVVVVTTLMVGE
jgi:hypothetical protein